MMIQFHPEFLKKNGKNEFVVLPYEEFVTIQELLEDAEDALLLEQARREDQGKPGVSLEEVMKRFGITPEDAADSDSSD
jgi:hypothetical protein